MNKTNNKNKTQSTQSVGGSDYKGYNSVDLGGYDELTDDIESTASSMGGVLDNYSKTYGGQRYKFRTKAERDRFNDYIKKQQDKKKQDKENQLNEIIRRCVKKVIYESFSSSLLRRIAAQHGGIWMAYTRGGNKQVPVSEITDDMFDTDKVVYPYGPAYEKASNHGVTFNDDSALPFASYDTEGGKKVVALAKSFEPTRSSRDKAKNNDGSRYYQPRSYKSLRARDIRQSMQIGYNTVKDEMNKYNTNDWSYDRNRHRDAQNMVKNAKSAYRDLRDNGDKYNKKYY